MKKNNEGLVAIFLPHLGSGGLTKVMLSLANGLIKSGLRVDLIMCTHNASNDLRKLIPAEVNLIELSSKRTITSLLPLTKYLYIEKPQCIISAGPAPNCVNILAKKIALSHTKTILTEHSLPSFDVYGGGKILDIVIPFLMRRLYHTADHIVAVSTAVANDLSHFIDLPARKIKVIYNPIVNQDLLDQCNDQVDHRWLNNKKHPVVVFVGRLVELKNIPLIVRALAIVNKTLTCNLLIIGDGPEKELINKEIARLGLENNIELLGYSSNPYPYISQSDVLVLASKWEGLPTVLIEALACDTPAVATNNLDGAIEILGDSEFGIICEQTKEDIADSILKVISGSSSFNDLKKRANLYSSELSIKKYIKLISS